MNITITAQELLKIDQQAYRNGKAVMLAKYDISPEQYHAGLDRLWRALNLTTTQSEDVFTLASQRLKHLTEVLETIAHYGTDQPAYSGSTEGEWYRSVAYRLIGIAAQGIGETK
jgi:hypothetical protein